MDKQMPVLPYANDALEPVVSRQTIEFHYGKHLQTYVNALASLTSGTAYADKSLEDIVRTAPAGAVFNNAGQIFNHVSYFMQFRAPQADNAPKGALAAKIDEAFGSFDEFKKQFAQAAATLFGSGWAWLSLNAENKLVIKQYPNANCPIRDGEKPLLVIDVWEHAYYLDYQNRRADYIAEFWKIINWQVVEKRMK
ncbi:MAG: superoxide dismutase [Bacteroidales bacterium]|nr:superoxide dismutase [Bacteroidales bacterium]